MTCAAQPTRKQALLRGAWGPAHRRGLRALHAQRQRRRPIRHQVHPQDLQRQQRQRHPQERRQQHRPDFRRVGRQQVADELADIVIDDPPLFHGGDDGREIIIQQRHVRRLLRHIRANPPHRDPDIRLPQRGRVIHAVARHRDDMPPALQRLHDGQLMLRSDTRVDRRILHPLSQLFDRTAAPAPGPSSPSRQPRCSGSARWPAPSAGGRR